MNRRVFLLGSAAGAFAIGCSLGPTGGKTWRHYQRTGEFQPNAWIRILADNTILFTLDRTEMGQGTFTSHAAMVCEELEADPTKIQILHAEASRSYDNPDKQLLIQITGGSTSVIAQMLHWIARDWSASESGQSLPFEYLRARWRLIASDSKRIVPSSSSAGTRPFGLIFR